MKRILGNKYEVLKPIAEGGIGSVYLVKDLHLNALAAVKICKNPENMKEREIVKREMEVLKQLSHPALPRMIDFFEEGGNSCLVMEYVEGITLEQYLRKCGRVETKQAVRWAVELTEVLGYLHSRKPPVIYRDLKPANIMIQPEGTIKLVDFGAAFVSSYGQERQQMIMGTPGYGAPEQWQGSNVGKRSDIYGIGAVLHEMLTGIPPRQFSERRPVREYDRSIPVALERIISVCVKKRPSERYQTMEQLKNALSGYKKKGKLREVIYQVKRGIGMLLWIIAGGKAVLPFLQGVRQQDIPFPYLEQPLLIGGIAVLYHVAFCRSSDGKNILRKQEKSIFLTEKKFSGLYALVFLFLLLSGGMVQKEAVHISDAAEKEEDLWVEMRDDKNRKLLLKDGAVYYATERVCLEIPVEKMPEMQIALQLVATGEEGIYKSRIFLLNGKAETEEAP